MVSRALLETRLVSPVIPPFTIAHFIEHLKVAALSKDPVFAVRQTLSIDLAVNPGFLPARYTEVNPDRYARRPLYIDPESRFSVLALAWSQGQGTPLHDHSGLWVVEGVYAGRMRITNYDSTGSRQGLHQFEPVSRQIAVPGQTDQRVPPSEHHVMENIYPETAVTIHVYGGVLTRFNTFESTEGGYRKHKRDLQLDVKDSKSGFANCPS